MAERKTARTFTAQIYIAGDLADAKRICRDFCNEVGLCVTVEPLDFIYTGGAEAGVRVGLINYPRFPVATANEIVEKATALAECLRDGLFQHSFSIVTPTETIWDTRRQPA